MSTDHDLLRRWAAGDKSAGNELFNLHFVAVFRFFRSKLPEQADQLTQSTFLAVLEGQRSLRDDTKFRAWLYGIARRQLLRHLEGRGQLLGGRSTTQLSIEDLVPSPSAVAAGQQRRNVLLESMRAITLDFQIVLELYYWDDLSTTEIAEALEIAPGTVKSRLSRARDALKTELQRRGAQGISLDLRRASLELRDDVDRSEP